MHMLRSQSVGRLFWPTVDWLIGQSVMSSGRPHDVSRQPQGCSDISELSIIILYTYTGRSRKVVGEFPYYFSSAWFRFPYYFLFPYYFSLPRPSVSGGAQAVGGFNIFYCVLLLPVQIEKPILLFIARTLGFQRSSALLDGNPILLFNHTTFRERPVGLHHTTMFPLSTAPLRLVL